MPAEPHDYFFSGCFSIYQLMRAVRPPSQLPAAPAERADQGTGSACGAMRPPVPLRPRCRRAVPTGSSGVPPEQRLKRRRPFSAVPVGKRQLSSNTHRSTDAAFFFLRFGSASHFISANTHRTPTATARSRSGAHPRRGQAAVSPHPLPSPPLLFPARPRCPGRAQPPPAPQRPPLGLVPLAGPAPPPPPQPPRSA